nr:MAG: hypothetical protein [Bacteriophage sp.]
MIMEKCLVTKLKGVVSDTSIKKLGELRLYNEDKSKNSFIYLVCKEGTKITAVGGYFMNKSTDVSIGNEYIIPVSGTTLDCKVSKETEYISISDKYSINTISAPAYSVKLEELYSENLQILSTNEKTTGNISAFKNTPNLEVYQPSGYKSKAYGDISVFALTQKLKTLILSCCNITGDISVLSKCHSLTQVNMHDIGNPLSVYGDLSTLPSECISFASNNIEKLSWNGTRPSNSKIISLFSVRLYNFVDAMLINQAECVAATSGTKQISVVGTRTSASDAAIATLQSKGYTVSITPA